LSSRFERYGSAMEAKTQLVEQLLDLLWRQWTTLGVAGMEGTGSTAIDLEALLVLTAQLSPQDPRLRDEALDWCIKSHRLIAKPRLKQLVKLASPTARNSFGSFASTLQHHVGGMWPAAEQAAPWDVRFSEKSRAPSFDQPALIGLKARALFGVGARADVITALLNWPAPAFGAADLVFIGYTKRNLADALDNLTDAGLFGARREGNRLRFSWRKRRELGRLLEPLPKTIPRWPPIVRVLAGFLDLLVMIEGKSERLRTIEAVKAFEWLQDDLSMIGLEPPRATGAAALQWSAILDWMLTNTRELTQGLGG